MGIKIGDRVGTRKMLTVIGPAEPTANGTERVTCKCDCGTVKVICKANLSAIASCGCYRKQFMKTHGQYKSVEYRTYKHMVERCTNESCKMYPHYGGRGISVCERWMTFENFLADMGVRPSPKHSLDRINNDGNYEPGNCRWATGSQQMRNTRRTRMITHNGETLPLKDWSIRLGLGESTIQSRLDVYGWTVEQALTIRNSKGKKPVS